MADVVLHVDDERSIGNSIIVMLRPGFQLPLDRFQPTHVFGVDSRRELKAHVKRVVPCSCAECKGAA